MFTKKRVIVSIASFVFVVLPLSLVGLYLYSLQVALEQGQGLLDEHCFKVNPLIANRKSTNYDFFRLIAGGSATKDEVRKAQEDYKNASAMFVDAEKKWLEEYKEFLDSEVTQFYLSSELYELGRVRYLILQKELEISQIMVESFESQDDEDLLAELQQEMYASQDAKATLNQEFDKLNVFPEGWQYRLIKIPQTSCPTELLNIQDFDIPSLFTPKISPEKVELTG